MNIGGRLGNEWSRIGARLDDGWMKIGWRLDYVCSTIGGGLERTRMQIGILSKNTSRNLVGDEP